MGEMIEFPSNGSTLQGYLAGGDRSGPGVVVIQEWWGLNDNIKDICERFAAEGYVALAPDLYHGELTTEPDQAGKLLMALNVERAANDMVGAVDEVQRRDGRDGGVVGVTGFCMGGGLALYLATLRPDAVRAVAPFYGVIAWPDIQPDYATMQAAVLGHYAGNDEWLPEDAVRGFETQLRDLGKDAELFIYPDTEHGFFNDTRPEVHDAAASAQAWDRTLEFFGRHLK